MFSHIRQITFGSRTAAKALLYVLTAVLFATGSYAGDSALYSLDNSLSDLVYGLSRSVVTVEISQQSNTSRFGRTGDQTYTRELTTGVVVDSFGAVLVAARPVLGKDRIVVRSGQLAIEAVIVAVDYQTELALLRPEARVGQPVTVSAQHGCAGQMVVAMSHAFGQNSSPALGFCAGLRNDGHVQFSIFGPQPGVGTGIFDLTGHLVGFISGAAGTQPGIVIAVPGYQLPGIISHLLHEGDRQSGFAGITTQEIEINPGIPVPGANVVPASTRPTTDRIDRGVVVTSVIPGSPAHRAGLLPGDLVYAVDGMPVNSAAGIANLVRQSPPGLHMALDLLRQHQARTVELVIGRKSLNLSPSAAPPVGPDERARLADSLRQALRQLQGQLELLEERIDGIH